MKTAATAGTSAVRDIEGQVFARQALREWPTSCCRFAIIDARHHRCLRPSDVDIEVFEPKRELIPIQSLRSATELRTLQVLNDQPEALNLGTGSLQLSPLVIGSSGQVAHQPMQGIDVGGKRGEIEIHAASLASACGDTHADHYRESIHRKPANGQSLLASAGNGRAPPLIGRSPIDALEQKRQLGRSQRQCLAGRDAGWP